MTSETVIIQQPPKVFEYLVTVKGVRIGMVHQLKPVATTIGRSAESDVRLDDQRVSEHHAKVKIEGPESKFVLFDLATTNGTKVNGAPINRHELSTNETVEIGDTLFVFKELRPQV